METQPTLLQEGHYPQETAHPPALVMASDITPEAISFLSAVGVFVVLLAVLLLFINRKLCFSRVGGLPCLEQRGKRRQRRSKGGAHLGLVDSYGEDDDRSTSSDSGDEVIKQFEISVSRSQSVHANFCERGALTAPELHSGHNVLLPNQEWRGVESSEAKECTKSSPEPQRGEKQEALCLRGSAEALELELCQISVGEKAGNYIQQTSENNLEMETTIDNLGCYHNKAPNTIPIRSLEKGDIRRVQCQLPGAQKCSTTCGDLITLLEYKPRMQRLLVTVVEARGMEQHDTNAWMVRLVLLPSRRRRFKTTVQRGPAPIFGETFRFSHLDPSELACSALRLRLYIVGGVVGERLVGQGLIHLNSFKPEGKVEVALVLEARSNVEKVPSKLSPSAISQSESISSSQSLSHCESPELLLGLSYNAVTGHLSVELIKGSNFRSYGINRLPDTYGKLTLLDSVGQEISRCKTSLRRGQPHPVYKETFVFQVALFQLSDVTLLVSIYSRRSMTRKELLGWVSLGHNASDQEERLHWQDMRQFQGQQVCRWHRMQEA